MLNAKTDCPSCGCVFELELPWRSEWSPHPGAVLRDVLADRAITVEEFARTTHYTPNYVCKLMTGHVPVTWNSATKLSRATGVPAGMWMGLQRNFDEAQERVQRLLDQGQEIEAEGRDDDE